MSKPTGNRRVVPKGRPFAPGQSGNPSGRPKGYVQFLEAMREKSPQAIQIIQQALDSGDFDQRQWAVQQVLDRAWGKAPVAIAGEGGEGPAFIAIDTGIRRASE